ncbi:hypothetical protein [Variovorax saccharolyticus]|uniref:hypothetical protein n=1 Tax=Variovorax saccharolyticus TaxID=3053516 RepID=UPI0025751BCC|nr:hypothetical protein [Variovorax sp. J31P216]MDM0028283.1 hypothetical protein [Variovorax sp. J31P216]
MDVQVMVPSAQASDMPMVQHAAHHNFQDLLVGGVRIFEYLPASSEGDDRGRRVVRDRLEQLRSRQECPAPMAFGSAPSLDAGGPWRPETVRAHPLVALPLDDGWEIVAASRRREARSPKPEARSPESGVRSPAGLAGNGQRYWSTSVVGAS